jgi:hypothetical protein
MDRAASAGAGATEGMMMPLSAALATELSLAAPCEGRRVGVPATGGRFEPVDDVLRGGWRLPCESAANGDALDGLPDQSRPPGVPAGGWRVTHG